jgi:hypothetical protein
MPSKEKKERESNDLKKQTFKSCFVVILENVLLFSDDMTRIKNQKPIKLLLMKLFRS